MLAVAVDDLVSDGILVWQVLVMQEMLPALGLLEVPDFSWGGRGGKFYFGVSKSWKKRFKYHQLKKLLLLADMSPSVQ